MRGYRFFEEFTTPALQHSLGSIIAVHTAGPRFVQQGGVCVGAVCDDGAESSGTGTVGMQMVMMEYLGTHCRRVTEAHARTVDPRLFEYLDRMA
ncbi:MAG TPA: hypothetical protein VFK13_07265 [Gemmatimonadaceae bacterium]|nr:hypothetical protein [Gemmatimonadaceae bacterium]